MTVTYYVAITFTVADDGTVVPGDAIESPGPRSCGRRCYREFGATLARLHSAELAIPTSACSRTPWCSRRSV